MSAARAAGEAGGAGGEPATPLCRTPGAAAAATDLLLALVHGCVPNMAALANLLEQMFYSGECADTASSYTRADLGNIYTQVLPSSMEIKTSQQPLW